MLLSQSNAIVMNWPWLTNSVLACAAVLFAVVLFIVLLFRHFRASRQFLHTERMRSLETGVRIEALDEIQMQAKQSHNAFWISFWLAFGVPTAAFSAAAATTSTVHGSTALSIVTWVAAAVASVAAVVCATVLMVCSRSRLTYQGAGLSKTATTP